MFLTIKKVIGNEFNTFINYEIIHSNMIKHIMSDSVFIRILLAGEKDYNIFCIDCISLSPNPNGLDYIYEGDSSDEQNKEKAVSFMELLSNSIINNNDLTIIYDYKREYKKTEEVRKNTFHN